MKESVCNSGYHCEHLKKNIYLLFINDLRVDIGFKMDVKEVVCQDYLESAHIAVLAPLCPLLEVSRVPPRPNSPTPFLDLTGSA